MEDDGAIANGQPSPDSPPPAVEAEASPMNDEVELLLKEIKASKTTIADLESQIDGYVKAKRDMSLQIEKLQDEVKSMESVVSHVSNLEGDVSRLQHDLGSSMAESEEATAECARLKALVGDLEKEKASLAEKVSILEEKTASLEAERSKLAVEKEQEVRGLEAKLERALRELEEKDGQVGEAQKLAADAITELEALQGSMDELKVGVSSGRKREVEIEIGSDGKKEKVVEGFGSLTLPWAVTAVSAGTAVVVAGVICYLRYSRER